MLLVLDGQHEFAGEHRLGRCEQFDALFAELLDFRVGVAVFVSFFYDMRELGQVYFVNEIGRDAEHVEAAQDVFVFFQVFPDVAVDGLNIGLAVLGYDAVRQVDAQKLGHFVSRNDFALVIVGHFVGEFGQAGAGPDDAVVKPLGMGVPVVLAASVQAFDCKRQVDKFEHGDMLAAPFAELFQPLVVLYDVGVL